MINPFISIEFISFKPQIVTITNLRYKELTSSKKQKKNPLFGGFWPVFRHVCHKREK